MSDNDLDKDLTVPTEREDVPMLIGEIEFADWNEPADMMTTLKDNNLLYEMVKVKDLIDKRIIVWRVKEFPSRYPGQQSALYTVFSFDPDGQRYATVIGSASIMEKFRLYMQVALDTPPVVTITQVAGGAYGSYYDLK